MAQQEVQEVGLAYAEGGDGLQLHRRPQECYPVCRQLLNIKRQYVYMNLQVLCSSQETRLQQAKLIQNMGK